MMSLKVAKSRFFVTAFMLGVGSIAFVAEPVTAQTFAQAPVKAPVKSSAKARKSPAKATKAPAKATKASSRSSGVSASVVTEGALVYTQPDFDADVIATLKAGQRVRVSRGTTGRFGKFHKVRVNSQIGYVADIDVQLDETSGAPKASATAPKDKDEAARPATAQTPEQKAAKSTRRKKKPFVFTRYVGFLIGQSEYKESIPNLDASTSLLTYGLKMTGPDIFFPGPIIDLNVALHYGAPSYYDRLSFSKPSGYILFSDFLFVLPYYYTRNFMAYVEAGPLLTFSSFRIINGNRLMTLAQLNVGGSFVAGAGYRLGPVALRFEGKYMLEKQSYKALQLSVQTEF